MKCEKYKKEFEQYISFGHPDKSFDYKWTCGNCQHVNVLTVFGYIDRVNQLKPIILTKYTKDRWMED